MDNSDTSMIMNSLPAILIGGAPHTGKSVLTYNLTQALRKREILHYVFRASPDGEGDWFLDGDSEIVETVRQIYIKDSKWTDTFRQLICRDLSRRLLPLIVDIGGLPTEKDNCIFHACTHSILLLKDDNEELLKTWHNFTTSNGLIPFAELHTQTQGHPAVTAQKPVFTGNIVIPRRGMNISGKPFNQLVDRVAELFHTYSPVELERLHQDKAPAGYIVHLRERLEELAPYDDVWSPSYLESLLAELSTQEPLCVYGRGPDWLYGALALHARTQHFYQFDQCLGWIEPPLLQPGTPDLVSQSIVRITPETREGTFLVTIRPVHNYLDYVEATQLVFPEPPPDHGVIVSGKLPLWLFTALARFYAERDVPWIALNYARVNQAFVIYSRVSTHVIGGVLTI